MDSYRCEPCTAIKNLGCFNACGEIELPMYAPVDGVYKIEYYKSGVWISREIEILSAPERFVIASDFFPENQEVIFRIFDPDGNTFKYNILRDKLGVKNLINPPDNGCCSECIIYFKLKTEFNFSLPETELTEIIDICEEETGSLSS